ncbi:uncharacterized protein LOC118470502 [Amphiprion ocellaris]|uniref:A-kinase anchor protein 2 C-terminal domain-containing protein n=1 Tax=Amphiprion ocellaris TaxID=80972 RepID=A0AAQ5ZYL0_AMPOC|nr:uncharacterized protein LOC118470502 [Amphiprion ocellaris]
METRDSRPSSGSLSNQDDGGLWMKMDCNHVSNQTESPSVASGETPQDETIPGTTARYYSVMDDEGADDVFIPPSPPSCMAPLPPADGGTGATADNSGVSVSGAADATEAEANPSSLDWYHGQKHLMAAQNEVDEVIASVLQASMEKVLLSNDKDSTPPSYQDQTSMDSRGCLMETCHDAAKRHYQDDTDNEESNEEPEDIVILREGQENWGESNAEKDQYPNEISSSHEENSEKETCSDKDGDKTKYEDICGLDETDSKLSREKLDSESDEPNTPTLSDPNVNDCDFECSEAAEVNKHNRSKTDAATSQPQAAPLPAGETSDNEEHVDSRSLDYNLTKYNWVRRESGTEMQMPQPPISKDSAETVTSREHEDGGKRIATDIQQGEQLLQRLQMVQLRHDVHMSENPQTSQKPFKDMRGEEKGASGTELRERKLTDEEMKEESRFHTVMESKTTLMEKEKTESKDIQTKARMSSSDMPEESEHNRIAAIDSGDSGDEQSDRCVPADLPSIISHETSTEIPFLSTGHRFSAAETSMEKQLHEAAQEKKNLQRAGGVFNLTDNPDVLEIPFKTNISLESLLPKAEASHRSDWQFSEQKMQKEISQEVQRELVLVNQGKIPGGYSKGEVRHLKETKLLFETFQQDNMEGPTRLRKPPNTVIQGPVYPSVLERTRSLEMFSLKSCPVSRAHSLRLCKSTTPEREKSPENFRSKSPTGGSRDKTRLSPYSKQDKHLRLHRSMDSIRTDGSTLAVETRGIPRKGNAGPESPILRQNPFFKLRPALALQPEVEKDIREAKQREEELRRQRCTLYGENRRNSEDEDKSRRTQTDVPDIRKRGKLERVWPPLPKKDPMKSEQTQQEAKVHRAGGQKAPLWQRWESGMINGQPAKEKK